MSAPTEDQKQDGLEWLFDQAATTEQARWVMQLISTHETRENTVIGMCTAPDMTCDRVRHYLLTGELT